MFGFFRKKSEAEKTTELGILLVYGKSPPKKRANVLQAIVLANELLMGVIEEKELAKTAFSLNDCPTPFSTHELAISVAFKFFKKQENILQLDAAHCFARLVILEWYREGLVVSTYVRMFEDFLSPLYDVGL